MQDLKCSGGRTDEAGTPQHYPESPNLIWRGTTLIPELYLS